MQADDCQLTAAELSHMLAAGEEYLAETHAGREECYVSIYIVLRAQSRVAVTGTVTVGDGPSVNIHHNVQEPANALAAEREFLAYLREKCPPRQEAAERALVHKLEEAQALADELEIPINFINPLLEASQSLSRHILPKLKEDANVPF